LTDSYILYLQYTILALKEPYVLRDPDSFTPANPLVTPAHIQPEWYFLFANSIIRSISNKLGGVTAQVMSISILFIIPTNKNSEKHNSTQSTKYYSEQ